MIALDQLDQVLARPCSDGGKLGRKARRRAHVRTAIHRGRDAMDHMWRLFTFAYGERVGRVHVVHWRRMPCGHHCVHRYVRALTPALSLLHVSQWIEAHPACARTYGIRYGVVRALTHTRGNLF